MAEVWTSPLLTLLFFSQKGNQIVTMGSLTWLTAKSRSVGFSSQLIKICVCVGGCFSTAQTTTKKPTTLKSACFPTKKVWKNRLWTKKKTVLMTLHFSSSCVYKEARISSSTPHSHQCPGCMCSDQPIFCCILHMASNCLERAFSSLCIQGLSVTCFVGPECCGQSHRWQVSAIRSSICPP